MDSQLTWEALQAKPPEQRRRRVDVRRSARAGIGRAGESALEEATVTVRFATPRDSGAIERLAELDSGSAPDGPALVAELDGELVAVLPLRHGRVLADPFRPTADIVRLLELREAQLRGGRRRRIGLRRWANRRAAPLEMRP
jgi:hypothetical protein